MRVPAKLFCFLFWTVVVMFTQHVVSDEHPSDAEEYEDYFDHLMQHENAAFGFDAHHEDTPEEQDMYTLLDPDHSLLVASEHGKVDKIKEALARGAHMGTRNNFGVTPLIFAANNGHMNAAEYLLDLGADIDAISNNGRTAVLWATYWGHLEMVQYLVSRGALIDTVDFGKYNEQNCSYPSNVFNGVIFLRCFFDMYCFTDGITPLMGAVKHGNMELIHFLLEKGADASVINDHGGSAYTIARAKGLHDIMELLRPHHRTPEHPNPYKIMLKILHKGLIKQIHYLHYHFRKWTGLSPFELTEEL